MFASFLVLAASPLLINVQAGVECTRRDYDNTKIEISVDHKPVIISRDRTLHDLHKQLGMDLYKRDVDHGEEYYVSDEDVHNKEWLIGGTSHGDVKTNTTVNFLSLAQDSKKSKYCVLFKELDIDISYQTKITVAADFEEGGCEYNAVLAHEKKRHETYTDIVDLVSNKLRKDIRGILDSMEVGYIPGNYLQTTYNNMTKKVREVVSVYREKMLSMMKEYNDVVDSPEALQNLASTCVKQKIEKMKEKAKKPENTNSGGLGDYLKDFRNKE